MEKTRKRESLDGKKDVGNKDKKDERSKAPFTLAFSRSYVSTIGCPQHLLSIFYDVSPPPPTPRTQGLYISTEFQALPGMFLVPPLLAENNSTDRHLVDSLLLLAFERSVSDTQHPGSAITNGREPRSCLGRVFNSKLGRNATLGCKCMVFFMQPLLKLKTLPKARPVS